MMSQLSNRRRTEEAALPQQNLSSPEYTTALAHLYRAEVTKSNVWRRRLDTTTNWAVVTSAAAITFVLGDKDLQRHIVILLTSLLVTLFLLLEARRYRHYDIWQTRVHLLESYFFAPLVCREESDGNWTRLLAADLRWPAYHIPYREALGWRLRRNYVWLYGILLLTWLAKIALHPSPASAWIDLVSHAAIGPLPGWGVLAWAVLFNGSLIVLALVTWGMQSASGEVTTPAHTRDKMRHTEGSASPTPAV